MAAGNRNWQKSLENPEDHEAVINAAARLVVMPRQRQRRRQEQEEQEQVRSRR